MWKWREVKGALGHFALLATVTIYTTVGAMIFRNLEYPAEMERLNSLKVAFEDERDAVQSWKACRESHDECHFLIEKYTEAVINACKGGVNLPLKGNEKVVPVSKWTFSQAAFFATTVLTTIGYGNLVPATSGGRLFCIMFALIGIPLTLTVIADMGALLATAVSGLHDRVTDCLPKKKKKQLVSPSVSRWLTAFSGILFLMVYMAAGAALFMAVEEGWGFFEGFYFCFITMTTIGFGDLVPGTTQYMTLCIVYILVGLSLTSTIIELVRRQYAQSWKTIQALSGPFAESLKKLGESAGTGIDVTLLHGDIRRLLMAVNVTGKHQSAAEWQAAVDNVLRDIEDKKLSTKKKQSIFQIIVYESSV